MLTAATYASGKWGVSFRQRNDVLFCWVERGECQFLRAGSDPRHLQAGDFIMVRTATPFALASDTGVELQDSETLVEAANDPVIRLNHGTSPTVILRGGRFLFEAANEHLLMDLLPPLIHVSRDASTSWRVQSLLKLNQTESAEQGPGSEFILTRLVEVILVELLRQETRQVEQDRIGLLAGLGDPITARALSAMHADVARDWTVTALAHHCNVSRSTFAAHFRKTVGISPIDYLLRWRMTLARDALRHGRQGVEEIAFAIGFQSSSAFSTAFTKANGCSPRQFRVQCTSAASIPTQA